MKGKTLSLDSGKEREEITPFPTKPKTKKQPTTKKENQVEKSRFVEIVFKIGVWGFGGNNFWDILYNLQASRRHYQLARLTELLGEVGFLQKLLGAMLDEYVLHAIL